MIRAHLYPLLLLLFLPGCTSSDPVYDLSQNATEDWDQRVRTHLDDSEEPGRDDVQGHGVSEKKNEHLQLEQDGVRARDLVDLALERNKEIHEARARWKSAVHSARTVSGLPDPQLMTMVAFEPVQTRDGPVDWQASLTQKFPWFGTLEAKEKRQLAHAGRAHARYRRKRNTIRKRVKEQFAEYRYLDRAQGVLKEMKQYLRRMEESVREAYESGEAPVHDLLRLENEYENVRTREQDLMDREQAVRAELNQLLDRAVNAPLGEPEASEREHTDLDRNKLRQALITHRPGIDEATFRQRAAEQELRSAELSYYPDFSAGILYSGVGASEQPGTVDAGSNAYGAQFTLDLPLWQGQRDAAVRSARAESRSARMQLHQERNRAFARLSGVLAELREVERQIDLYQDTILPNAERSLSSAREQYVSGEMDIVSFLDFQNRLLMARLDLHRSRAERRKTVAKLEKVIGIALDRISGDR